METPIAKYTLVWYRGIPDEDGYEYHNGSEADAITQFVRELQEAVDIVGLPVGEFRVEKRVIQEGWDD